MPLLITGCLFVVVGRLVSLEFVGETSGGAVACQVGFDFTTCRIEVVGIVVPALGNEVAGVAISGRGDLDRMLCCHGPGLFVFDLPFCRLTTTGEGALWWFGVNHA